MTEVSDYFVKRIMLFLSALMAPFLKGQSPKLGGDDDPIRQMLFANQPIKELLRRVKLDGNAGPFQTIADASKLADQGDKKGAADRLRSLLATSNLETRLQLLAWSGLRELGEVPDPKSAGEVLGVIIEMPMSAAYDTLAAYVDGTARYLNYSGAAIFWDTQDVQIKNLCQAFVDSTIPSSSRAKPRSSVSLPKSGAQVTLLTRSGNYVVAQPPQPVIDAGAALMIELMNRARQRKQ